MGSSRSASALMTTSSKLIESLTRWTPRCVSSAIGSIWLSNTRVAWPCSMSQQHRRKDSRCINSFRLCSTVARLISTPRRPARNSMSRRATLADSSNSLTFRTPRLLLNSRMEVLVARYRASYRLNLIKFPSHLPWCQIISLTRCTLLLYQVFRIRRSQEWQAWGHLPKTMKNF